MRKMDEVNKSFCWKDSADFDDWREGKKCKNVGWEKVDLFWMGYNAEGRLVGRIWRRVTDHNRGWAAVYYTGYGQGFSMDGFTESGVAKRWVDELAGLSGERICEIRDRKIYASQDLILEDDGLL